MPGSTKDKAIVELTGDVSTDRMIWTEKIYNEILNREASPSKWASELSQELRENMHNWQLQLYLCISNIKTNESRSIFNGAKVLVLLYNFSESPDSLLGYQLCCRLVKEGHRLYVTTTSVSEWLKSEIQRAEQLTMDSDGSITLLTPQCRDDEEPSPEWIANSPKQYFGYLSEYKEIDLIIGTLPGTTQTAIELKETLNCKLFFWQQQK